MWAGFLWVLISNFMGFVGLGFKVVVRFSRGGVYFWGLFWMFVVLGEEYFLCSRFWKGRGWGFRGSV